MFLSSANLEQLENLLRMDGRLESPASMITSFERLLICAACSKRGREVCKRCLSSALMQTRTDAVQQERQRVKAAALVEQQKQEKQERARKEQEQMERQERAARKEQAPAPEFSPYSEPEPSISVLSPEVFAQLTERLQDARASHARASQLQTENASPPDPDPSAPPTPPSPTSEVDDEDP
jgi:hypothetical protein